MKRTDLEHVIRAAADIAKDKELVIIGAAAILGQCPDAPRELRITLEVDLYPKNHPERSDQIDGAIGEQSAFHNSFGYYVHGVGPETATLPKGWEKRLVAVCNKNTRHATGYCLEVNDLAVSKLAAGREKDLIFISVLLKHRIIKPRIIQMRLMEIEKMTKAERDLALVRLKRIQLQCSKKLKP